eukprot:4420453-Pleurochrysis_carterae.AAC.2
MSLAAVRLYLAGLPPEPSTGPLDVYPISEAWSHSLRDLVHFSSGSVPDKKKRARTQAGLRLKRQALREARFEDEERGRRGLSPLESASEERAADTETRMRADNPTLTVAVAPEKSIFADTLHAEVNLVAELTPYHGVSPILTGPDGVPPGPRHQLKTLVDTMQSCMVSCLQASYADREFEQRLARSMYTDHRTAPVETVAEFAQLVGWELTLFGGVLATSEPE